VSLPLHGRVTNGASDIGRGRDLPIVVVRGHRVLLDEDLARLYGVETRSFNQAVRRNRDRFPGDFMLELTEQEHASLRSQIVILDVGRGRHRKFPTLAFTEQGVAMLSSVLRSPRAVAVNIEIMRAFVAPGLPNPCGRGSQVAHPISDGVVAYPTTRVGSGWLVATSVNDV